MERHRRSILKHVQVPEDVSLAALLKDCALCKDLQKGTRIHAYISQRGLFGKDIYISNNLVNMYAKCGELVEAQEVFDVLPFRDVVSWTVLMDGYLERGHGDRALSCFELMRLEGLSPNAVTYLCVLKACNRIGAAAKGVAIHIEIDREGYLEKNILIGSTLVDMYAKLGALEKAQEVFVNLPHRNVVSWNALMAGYAQHGHAVEVLSCFKKMQQEGVSPDPVTFLCVLKACGNLKATETGKEIHAMIIKMRLLEKHPLIGGALVDMHAKCGELAKAQEVFDRLPVQSVVSWSALIAGYAQHGHGEEALTCYEYMRSKGVYPNSVTILSILKACGSIGAVDRGEMIHAEIVREGFLDKNPLVGNALVDMYVKLHLLGNAREVFNELRICDTISWNVLMAGYAQQGHGEEVLNCFRQMQNEGLSPDEVSFLCVLKACGTTGAIHKGKEIHAKIVRRRLLEKDGMVGNALVDMYAKCGAFSDAHDVFEMLPVQDVVSWNALIAGYAQYEYSEEVLLYFECMKREGLSPDKVTYLSVLKACGNVGAADLGKDIHATVVREGFLQKDMMVGNVLVGMYAKCGMVTKAQEVFTELPVRNVISWNNLIAAFAQSEKYKVVFNTFNKMVEDSMQPNLATFRLILTACSHSGLLDEGQMCLDILSTFNGIIPTSEEYTCMVDLLGRAGLLVKALIVIKTMPCVDCFPIWVTFLSSCQKWGNVKLGRVAFEYCVLFDRKDTASYVSMSNIYGMASMKEDAAKIENMGVENAVWEGANMLDGCVLKINSNLMVQELLMQE